MYKRLLPLAIATFAVGTDGLVIAGLLRPMAASLQVSMAAAGQLVTVFSLTFALAAPILGAVTSNLPRRHVLLGAVAVFIAGNVIVALGPHYPAVMAGRVISALGAALISSMAMATASAIAPPQKRGRALAVVTAGMTVATAFGVPLGTLIGGADWRVTMWVVAALGAVAGVGIWRGLPHVDFTVVRLGERLRRLGDPAVLLVLAVTWAILTSGYTLYTYIGVATTAATGGTAAGLTIVLVAYGAGSIAGNVVSGFLTDRWSPVRVLLAGLVVLVTTLAVTPWATATMATALLWALVWGVAGWLTGLPQQHRLVSLAPESAAVLLGLNSAALQLGIATGGGIGGLVLRWADATWLPVVSAAIAALALVITVVTASRTARQPEARTVR